jgi:hypothetical protein
MTRWATSVGSRCAQDGRVAIKAGDTLRDALRNKQGSISLLACEFVLK